MLQGAEAHPGDKERNPMTTDTKSNDSLNQILIWMGVAIVVLAVVYFMMA